MRAFAELIDRLAFEPRRNAKLALMTDYFRATPDPDRGYALAALCGALDFPAAKPALLKALIAERADPVLFALAYDYVGDLSETIALMWPAQPAEAETGRLGAIVAALGETHRAALPARIAAWLDALDEQGRWALLKLMTGGLRIGVSAALARQAVAALGGVAAAEVEEVWHAIAPPYPALFAWLEGRGPRPDAADALTFRAPMLAHPLDEAELAALDPADFIAEWKWDGIRVQAAARPGETRLFSRSGDEITAAFPDLAAGLGFDGVIDGELVVIHDETVAPFSAVQQRLNRKQVGARLLAAFPAHLIAYDLLFAGGEDLRALPLLARRARLEALVTAAGTARLRLSPLIPFADWPELAARRADSAADPAIEGVMLKRRDSPYLAGRPWGPWFKWKRAPDLVDCVLMYAQRGHGKRSSFYSDFTFGVWDGERLVPVGKAYFGFTDAELAELDQFVRRNTINRFGPVREVAHGAGGGLVLEIAYEGLQVSTRHRSGIAMRFPRIHRIRWDKPAAEADRIETLRERLGAAPPPSRRTVPARDDGG
ncbi:cisplatin damage response ATP-dependent DNA ligase [Rhabdaerophilum calidifontis]|uniref:cisplatin damage response ATP-dependent DNA ligase n=1 Tax=Rhabdaerophilum calidifontis TaxID=2604328 RepID=UPI00123AEEA4|nr:cisplatin damage response ATP-dependent DNA ligase [Rhabdaerophilum calidifontis]